MLTPFLLVPLGTKAEMPLISGHWLSIGVAWVVEQRNHRLVGQTTDPVASVHAELSAVEGQL